MLSVFFVFIFFFVCFDRQFSKVIFYLILLWNWGQLRASGNYTWLAFGRWFSDKLRLFNIVILLVGYSFSFFVTANKMVFCFLYVFFICFFYSFSFVFDLIYWLPYVLLVFICILDFLFFFIKFYFFLFFFCMVFFHIAVYFSY